MRRTLASLSIAFLAARMATPQPKPAAPAPKSTSAPVLEGVVRGPDGKPLEKALVTGSAVVGRYGDAPFASRTDEKGAFRIALREGGLVNVRIEAAGLAAKTLDHVKPGTPLQITLTRGGAITGSVKDAASGAPVAGARVWATESTGLSWEPGAGEVEARTNARGLFRIEGLGPGNHTVRAAARGFGRAQRTAVPLDGKAEFLLLPGGSLTGTVRDAATHPVAGALVRLDEERRPGRRGSALETTDANGRFEFIGVDAGRYSLIARHKDFAPDLATGITIEKGGDAQADLTLQAPVRVIGRLIGVADRPVGGRVQVQRSDGQDAPRALAEILAAEADADGRFRIDGVPLGSHALGVRAPGHAPKRVDFDVRAGDKTQDLGDIALEAGLAIRGVVRSTTEPVADAWINAWARNSFGSDGSAPEGVHSEADGTFLLGGLKPGTYTLTVSASGFGETQKAAQAGGEKVVILLEPAGTISGFVVDESDRPVQGFEVWARSAQREAQGSSSESSDSFATSDGRFTLQNVPSGTYVVQVAAPERASGSVSGVKVTPGATADVGKVRLATGGSIRGVVVDAAGAGIAGATITLGGRYSSVAFGGSEAFSDMAGAFELRGLGPGRTDVRATHPQFAPANVSGLEVDPAKGPSEARIVMSLGGRIEGRARRRDGRGIAGAQVTTATAGSGGRTAWARDTMVPVADDGTFLIERVPPGRTNVFLMMGIGRLLRSSQSVEVEVRDGETTPVDFQDHEILVTGRVTRSGQPAPNFRVALQGQTSMRMSLSAGPSGNGAEASSGPERMTGLTREDGAFELLADRPGAVWVSVGSADGAVSLPRRKAEIPDVESYVLDLDFVGQTVNGTAVDRDTERPLPDVSISAVPKKGSNERSWAETGADGRFQLEMTPGDYVLQALADGYAEEQIDLTVGPAGTPDVRIALGHGESIKGRVIDSARRGVAGARVGAVTAQEPRAGAGAVTLADGSFEVSGLTPRAHNVTASSEMWGFAFRSGISPGDAEIVLTLRPGGKLLLRILGADGAPSPGALARVEKLGGQPASAANGSSDGQGTVELSVPVGTLEIRASKDNLEGRVTVSVPENGTATAEVRLAPKL